MPLSSGNQESDDSKKDISIDEIITKISEGLFGILFITNKHSDHNMYWHFLEIFIDHMQDLAFPLTFVYAPWVSSIVWFQTVLNWFSPEKLIGTNQILYDVLTGVMGLTLLNAAWVGYSFSQNRFRFIWTLKTLRVTLGLFSTVLFIPILAFFTDQISNCRSEDGSDLNCWSGGDLFQSIVTLVIMLLFVGLALAVKATFFEPDPTAKDVTSRPHSRLDMLYVLFRATLTVLSIALGTGQQYGSEFSQSATNIQALLVNNTSQTNGSSNILNSSTQPETHRRDNGTTQTHETELWVMTMACVILSFTLASMYIWYIPFYNYRYSVLRAGMMVNFFWASLCMVYTNSFPGSDIGIAFLLFSPLSFVFAYYFVKLRRSLIDGMPFNTINDPLTVELKIRFKLLERGILFRDKVKTAGARYPGDAGGATGATTGTPVPNLSGAGCPDSAALEAAERVFLDEINQLYIQSIKMLPKSCRMYLLASSFQLIFLKNRAQCLAFTAKAALMMPKLDEAFMIFKRQRLLNDRFAGGDVIDFIAYEQNMKLAKINERKATIAGLQFWSELMKKYPSFYKLQTHGAAISSAVSLAQLHYITLIKLTPDSSDVYRLYGRFLINVLNDKKSGQELLDHAEELDDESLNQSEGSDDDGSVGSSPEYSDEEDTPRKSKATNLFCNDNCVITISGEQQNLGHMLSMNPNAMKLFGYKKNEWVGRNISAIVPSPFSEAHDGFLIKYLETGYAKVIERTRDVLGLHKEGFLIPMSLCVKHVVESNGKQTFVGIIKPSKPSASNGHLIFYSADQKIKHVTQNVANLFNYVPDKTKETFLYEWIPGISIEAIESKAGFISEFVTQEAIVKMKLSGEKLTIGETSAYICKAHINRRPHPKTTNADASMSPTSLPDELGESLEDVGAVPLVFSAHNSKADLASTGNQEVSQWTEATGEVISTKSISFDDLEKGAAIRVNHNLKKTKSESAKKLKEDKVDSSYSKSSSARNVKKIISNRSQHSNKQLNYIHAAFIVCFLVLFVCAIFQDLFLRNIYTEICNKINDLNTYLESLLRVIQICDSVRSIDLQRVFSSVGSGFYSTQSYSSAVDGVLNNTKYITSKLGLFLDRSEYAATLVDNNNEVIQNLNAFEAISVFIAFAQFAAQVPLSDPLLHQRIQLVLDNGVTTVMSILNESAVNQREKFTTFTYSQPTNVIISASAAPIFVLIVVFFVIFPFYYRIELYRDHFLAMFCDIPKEIVKGIHDAHLKRLVEAEEDSDDDFEDSAGLRAKMGLGIGLEGASSSGHLDDINPTMTELETVGSSVRVKFNMWTAFVRFFANHHHRIGLNSVGIMLITYIFFFVSGTMVYFYALKVENTATLTFWTKQRSIYASTAIFSARENFLGVLISQPQYAAIGTPYFTRSLFANLQIAQPALITNFCIDTIQWIDYDRFYGETNGYSMYNSIQLVVLDDSDAHVAIEVLNGCPKDTSIDASCSSLGMLSNGIQAALEYMNEMLLSVSQEILEQSEVGFVITLPSTTQRATQTSSTSSTPTTMPTYKYTNGANNYTTISSFSSSVTTTTSTSTTETTATSSSTTTTTTKTTSTSITTTTTTSTMPNAGNGTQTSASQPTPLFSPTPNSEINTTGLLSLSASTIPPQFTWVKDTDNTLALLRKLLTNFFVPSLQLASDYFWLDLQDNSTWFSQFHVSFTVCYVVALALIYVFVIRVMINGFAEELRRTAGLVYMLPPEIITTVPSFRKWAAMEGIKTYHAATVPKFRSREGSIVASPAPAKMLQFDEANAGGVGPRVLKSADVEEGL